MIPVLFAAGTTQFNTNGMGRLRDCINCTVTEELNGIYECEFQYPTNGQHYADIAEGCIIYATHDDSPTAQPFDIYSHTKPIDGIVTFYARHISYRLNKITVLPYTATSCAQALQQIPSKSINDNPFRFSTNKAASGAFALATPRAVRALLGGEEGSILDRYGGEYEFDGFNVYLRTRRGSDNGVTIRYGKNLLDITEDYDIGDAYNAVVPYWRDGQSGELTMLPGPDYAVSMAETLEQPEECVPLDLSDKFDTTPTTEQLRGAASDYLYDNMPWQATKGISVDFVALWQTEDYANIAPLTRVRLGDTVGVIYDALGITASLRVVRTVFNVLVDRFDSIELGRLQSTLGGTILSATQASTQAALNSRPTYSQVATQITGDVNDALQRFAGAQGGTRVDVTDSNGKPVETYYMDTDDMSTAVNVLRINNNGIAFSQSGVNGPYTSAWLLNGAFNAGFIRTGTLDANLIRAGVIQDVDGKSTWDLISGVMSLSGTFESTDYDSTTGKGIRAGVSDGVFKISGVEESDGGLVPIDQLQIEASNVQAGELIDGGVYQFFPVGINAREGSELFLYCGNAPLTDLDDGRPYIRVGKYAITIYGPINYENTTTATWEDVTVESGVTTPGANYYGGGRLQWMQDGDRIYFRGGIEAAIPTDGRLIGRVNTSLYFAGDVYYLSACSGKRIARWRLIPNGELYVQWVCAISNGAQYTGSLWIDANMSFSGRTDDPTVPAAGS